MSNPESSNMRSDQPPVFRSSVPDLSSLARQDEQNFGGTHITGNELQGQKEYVYSPQKYWSAEYVEQAERLMVDLSSRQRHLYESIERQQKIFRPNIDSALSFVHNYGLNTKPVYFLDPESFFSVTAHRESVWGQYEARGDAVIMRYDLGEYRDRYGTNYDVQLNGLVVHELAHSSSAYSNYFSINQEGEIEEKIRIGSVTEGSHGNALEEAFCDYMRQRYLKEIGYDPHIGPIHGTPEASALGDALAFFIQVDESKCKIKTDMEGAPPYGLKNTIKDLKELREEGLTGYVGRQLLWNKGNPGTLSTEDLVIDAYPFLAQALSFLIEDDPELLDIFIQSRSDVEGLRRIAQKLNALEPGLYKRLRDIKDATNIASEIQFQQIVVDALYAKYFPNEAASETN